MAENNGAIALSIKDLTKTYGNGVQALKSVSLEIPKGDFFALLGPNGAGKTTIIGITGSVGKTSTKEAIYTVLNRTFFVAKSVANTNNEIGVPCAVLGIEPSGTRDRHATTRSRRKFLMGLI